mgnify:CR=1 FL=1
MAKKKKVRKFKEEDEEKKGRAYGDPLVELG